MDNKTIYTPFSRIYRDCPGKFANTYWQYNNIVLYYVHKVETNFIEKPF